MVPGVARKITICGMALAGMAGVIGFVLPASADTGEATGPAFQHAWAECEQATSRIERERSIPAHLLGAISLAESGRWDGVNGETHAWPWTVTSGDRQWMLDTKAEAVSMVRTLQDAGTTNIDVGCMQINLRYHPDAFASLDAAFDPLNNARYAGSFLSNLFQSSGNWLTAAGDYHSNTEQYHNRYKLKVARFWNDLRKGATAVATANAGAVQGSATPIITPIDYQRTKKLNAAFRDRKQATGGIGSAIGMSGGDAGLRNSAGIGMDTGASSASAAALGASEVVPLTSDRYALFAQIQRVRKAADQRQKLKGLMTSDKVPGASKVQDGEEKINPDLLMWRKLYQSGPTSGPFLAAGN